MFEFRNYMLPRRFTARYAPGITQYNSTVYTGMATGGSALSPYIRKFQFSLLVSIQYVF